jgi:SAM-dependent methyltransferase
MQVTSKDEIFAAPLRVEDPADCGFYHTMEIPGHGIVTGQWDLRGGVDDYLGKVAFAGQRVLEIGPASGFLTFEMEKRGAEVVSVEVTAEHPWDFVPYPSEKLEEVFGPHQWMQRLKNSYWFTHAAHQSKAKVYYGDVYNLPAALGEFDIALMSSMLLHCRDPLRIVEQCGKMARLLIITDVFHPDLEGTPVCRLAPDPQNLLWHTWWQFSTQFFTQFLAVMGFTTTANTHQQPYLGRAHTLFTIVAQRSVLKAESRMLGASRFPAIALPRRNMKKLLRQMIVGTSLEPLARKVHAAFTRK